MDSILAMGLDSNGSCELVNDCEFALLWGALSLDVVDSAALTCVMSAFSHPPLTTQVCVNSGPGCSVQGVRREGKCPQQTEPPSCLSGATGGSRFVMDVSSFMHQMHVLFLLCCQHPWAGPCIVVGLPR